MSGGLVVMFLLVTADLSFSWRFLLRDPGAVMQGLKEGNFGMKLQAKYMLYVTNNLIAVSILVCGQYPCLVP